MKTNIILLVLVAALLSSCAQYDKHFYRITTSNSAAFDYRILETTDSSVRVIPWEYRDEMTPEVIREYSREIPYDSMTRFKKESTALSDINCTLTGFSIGSLVAPLIANQLSSTQTSSSNYYSGGSSSHTETLAIGLTLVAPIIGGIIGYLLSSHEDDMLPARYHHPLKETSVSTNFEQSVMQSIK